MNQKRKLIVAMNLLVCAGVVYFAMSHKETSLSSEAASAPKVVVETTVSKTSAEATSKTSPEATAQGTVPVSRRAASVVPAKAFEVSPEQRATLEAYAKIRRKVFLSDADKKEKAKLLRNRAFIASLVPIVTSSTAGSNDAGDVQNAALDVLYDALGSDTKEAAAQVLGQLAGDAQVESKDLPLKDRENLAGVKAEALYEWAARDPSAGAKISSLLPGKVSQQLWQNVQSRQDRNVAESAAEASAQK